MLFLRIRSSYFSSFSEVACKNPSVLRFRFLFSFVTFPQLSFFCQLTISYVFYYCYYSLVDENQVQLLYSPVSAKFPGNVVLSLVVASVHSILFACPILSLAAAFDFLTRSLRAARLYLCSTHTFPKKCNFSSVSLLHP